MAHRGGDKIDPAPAGWTHRAGFTDQRTTAETSGRQDNIDRAANCAANDRGYGVGNMDRPDHGETLARGVSGRNKAAYVCAMTNDITLFDRQTVRRHRDRAASTFADHDFLHREIADQLADRLHDVKRTFSTALDIGGGHGTTTLHPAPDTLVTADLSGNLLRQMPGGLRVSADEEFLPFGENTFDLVASTLSLHWVNDLPGALVQIRRALKPDGLFLAAMLGGDTLIELRRAFLEAEADLKYLEQLQGETPFSRLGLGTIAFKSGQDIDQAHQLFDTAIALEESTYRRKNYYYQRAEIYRQIGRHREAITDYSAAIKEDLLFEEAYFGRAQSKHAQSDLEGALADLVLIKSSIKGRLTSKARSLINAYLKTPSRPTGNPQNAASQVPRLQPSRDQSQIKNETRTDSDNGHREYLVRGLRYFYDDEFEAARKDFFRVISHAPNNSKAYFMLGEIAAQHDSNHLQACVFFKESYRLAPETPDYLLEVSRCLYREQKFSDAIQLLSEFIDIDKPSPVADSTLAQIYFLRGLCLEESGLMLEALKDMQQAYELDSSLKAASLFIRDHGLKGF